MPSHQQPKLSLFQRASLLLLVLYCLFRALVKFSFALLLGKYAGWPRKRIFLVSVLQQRPMLRPSTTRKLVPPTGEVIKRICKSNGLTHRAVDIDCDGAPKATLHYVTVSALARRTIYYLHGGGYISSISRGHVLFQLDCAKAAKANVVFLEYTLAPELPYPGQLIQAAHGLRHLQQKNDQLIVGGDSAGGNLVLALIAHGIKPCPGVPKIKPWYGAYLVSPWVELSYKSASYTSNSAKDYLGASIMEEITPLWKPKAEIWADPLSADVKFWKSLPVEKVLIAAGDAECFVDDDIKLAKKMGAQKLGSGAPVELAIAKGEVHVSCVVDATLRLPHGNMATDIIKWLTSV